ncbi:hypothetical protein FSARC_1175 [Fusarium sarcochroum]|uniref:Uncharacterized protein n=1 Tax=Fusarium sarcochroum TaxID=1208366 RepID=A0A8H4U9C4_9HYPO|nr:hypothetical protein FSARC_1175 [Fusarium sarcochroum]
MADPNESSQFLLQPLDFSTPQRAYHAESNADRTDSQSKTHEETVLQAEHDGNDHDHSSAYDGETSAKQTGLLFREAAPKSSSGKSVKTEVEDSAAQSSRTTKNIFLDWSLEIGLLLVATGLLAAMVAVLQSYNDDEMPNWNGDSSNGGITLNAIVALIATVFRAILAFVALELLAQLKWDWLKASFRPMLDIQRFDDASRGAWGSLKLLPVVILRQPLAVGAVLVVVLSLAIGPFTQQTVQTYYCPRVALGQSAHISVANRFHEAAFYYNERPLLWNLDVRIISAMQEAAVNPSKDSNIGSLFTCPSGNCTFPTFADYPNQRADERISHASLGMCSRCEDVYELVERGHEDKSNTSSSRLTLSLPVPENMRRLKIWPAKDAAQGTYLDANLVNNFTWASKVVPHDFINTARWSTVNFTIIALSQDRCNTLPDGNVSCPLSAKGDESKAFAWGEPTDYVAATCIMYPCIKYYAGSVSNTALKEKVVRSMPLRPESPMDLWGPPQYYYDLWKGVQAPCWVNDTLYTSSNMTSAAEKLPPNSKETVSVHRKDWAQQDIDAPVGYTNVTAPKECIMSLKSWFLVAVKEEIGRTFRAHCLPLGHQTSNATCFVSQGDDRTPSMPMTGLLRPLTTSLDTIRENIDSITMRLTTEIRRAGWGPYQQSIPSVKGESWENRTCLHVAWGWFSLPAGLLNGVVVWKASVLPFLLKDHVPAMETMSMKQLDIAAKALEVMMPSRRFDPKVGAIPGFLPKGKPLLAEALESKPRSRFPKTLRNTKTLSTKRNSMVEKRKTQAPGGDRLFRGRNVLMVGGCNVLMDDDDEEEGQASNNAPDDSVFTD